MVRELAAEVLTLRQAIQQKTFLKENSVESYIANDTFMTQVMQVPRAEIEASKAKIKANPHHVKQS